MEGQITLFNGPNSPFGRKTKVTAIVQEVRIEEKIIDVYKADFLDKYNPLRKIPTLMVNQLSITDSDNICCYLDSISKKETLFPKKNYWQIMNVTSIANGLMESVLERRMEIIRPENEKSNKFINKQEVRIKRTINWLEDNWKNYDDRYLSMDQIAIACALDYTIFRFEDTWKKKNTKLNKWFGDFINKDFMKATSPQEK